MNYSNAVKLVMSIKKWIKKAGTILGLFCLLVIGFILVAFAIMFPSEVPIARSDTETIFGTLSNTIEVKKGIGKRSNNNIVIKLNEYPKNIYTVNDIGFEKTNYKGMTKDLSLNDSIYLVVEKSKNEVKSNYYKQDYDVFEVKSPKKYYLLLDDYNVYNAKIEKWTIGYCLVFGLLSICSGLLGLFRHLKKK